LSADERGAAEGLLMLTQSGPNIKNAQLFDDARKKENRPRLGRGGGCPPTLCADVATFLRQYAAGFEGGEKTSAGIVCVGDNKPVVRWELSQGAVETLDRVMRFPGVTSLHVKKLEETDRHPGENDLMYNFPQPNPQFIPNCIHMAGPVRVDLIVSEFMTPQLRGTYLDENTTKELRRQLFQTAQRNYNRAMYQLGYLKRPNLPGKKDTTLGKRSRDDELTEENGANGEVELVLTRTAWNYATRSSATKGGRFSPFKCQTDLDLLGKWNAGEIKRKDLLEKLGGCQ